MQVQNICEIIRAEKLSPNGYSLLLNAGSIAEEAVPGQFVHIACDGLFLRRPLSICDADGPYLRVVFEARGAGTRQLSEKKEAEALNLLGPLGHGFSLDSTKILLVGGGVGAAPLLFAAKRMRGTADAVLGFRSGSAAILTREFETDCRRVCITSEDGSLGEPGLVDAPLRRLLSENSYDRVLACGPRPMLRAVAAAAAEAKVPCEVSMEERMGCGVGACLVCSCKKTDGSYSRVCRDGPVFDAAEVDFDA